MKEHDHRSSMGALGEDLIQDIIDQGGHRALHDVTIPDHRNGTTQIDHVVVIGGDVVCVETKHWNGRVVTRQNGKWELTTQRGAYAVDNPLDQNRYHATQMGVQLGNRKDGFRGQVRQFVVMSGPATFTCGDGNRNNIHDRADLAGVLETIDRMGSDEETALTWARVVSVARSNEWRWEHVSLHPDCVALSPAVPILPEHDGYDLPSLH